MVNLLDVLIVDDDVEEACVIARHLRARHCVRIAVGLRDAVHAIAQRVPDVIVCAHEMPPFRGDALLAMIASEHPEVRRVLFSRSADATLVDGDEIVHAVVRKPVDAAALLAAIVSDE